LLIKAGIAPPRFVDCFSLNDSVFDSKIQMLETVLLIEH
jgi:hypothetical protein